MAEEPVAIRSAVGQGGTALDVRSPGPMGGLAPVQPASGDLTAETREEVRRETVVDAQTTPHALHDRLRTSELEARVLTNLREAAERGLDAPAQEELARLLRVWNDIADANRTDLLPALDVAAVALRRSPPNLRTVQWVRGDLQRRLGGFGILRQNAPASNVVLGLMSLVTAAVFLLVLLAPAIDPRALLAGMNVETLLLVAAAGALGSVISVMRRIRDFKGSTVASPLVLYLTGAFKPVIGVGFALFVYSVLNSKLIAFSPPAGGEPYFFAAVGFLAGFSEKLAPDLMEKAEEALTTSSMEQTQTVSRRVRTAPRS